MSETAIAPAVWPDDAETVRATFRAYQAAIGVDLCFQDFAAELEGLPGDYAPLAGGVWLARRGGRIVGCVALRPIGAGDAELKRLYVAGEARGAGLGRRLLETALAAARQAGHRRVVLDTLPDMAAARALYRAAGFRPCAPYRAAARAELEMMALPLGGGAQASDRGDDRPGLASPAR